MANFEDKNKEQLAEAERLLRGKSNTLGKDANSVAEPFARADKIALGDILTQTPSAVNGLIAPDYDDYPTEGAVGTRYGTASNPIRLHSYLPSGLTGPDSVQTFIAIQHTPASHDPEDIDNARFKPLISPKFSQGKANAAHGDPNFRGFELALYPAKSNGLGLPLTADTTNGPISILADPGAGPPDDIAPGIGDEGFWTVDYDAGIVRFSRPPLNGSNGVMNPNGVYGDIEGTEVSDAYGTITMFAVYYHYTGEFGTTDNLGFVTVGDGYISEGIFNGVGQNTLQAAVDSLGTQGGTVFVKPGNYVYDGAVEIPASVSILGINGVIITKSSMDSAFVVAGSNCVLDNLTILSDGSNQGPVISLIGDDQSLRLENVTIRNLNLEVDPDSYGIAFAPEATNMLFKNITIENNTFIPILDGSTYIGMVQVQDGYASYERLNVLDNDFGNQPAIAVQFVGSQIVKFNDCSISRNRSSSETDLVFGSEAIISKNTNISNNNMSLSSVFLGGLGHDNLVISGSEFARLHLSDNGSLYSSVTNSNIDGNNFKYQSEISGKLNSLSISNNSFGEDLTIYGSPWESQFYGELGTAGSAIAYDGSGKWVAVGTYILASEDAYHWRRQEFAAAASNANLFDVKHNQRDLWVAVGNFSSIFTSTDGTTWTKRSSPFPSNNTYYAVIYDDVYNRWTAVGQGPTSTAIMANSTDGIDWTGVSTGDPLLSDIAIYSGSGLKIGVGNTGTVLTTTDAVTWTSQTSGTAENLAAIAVDYAGLFVVVGPLGTIITSTDGVTWTPRTSNTTKSLTSVTFAAGLWVVTGADRTLLTSSDGINWDVQGNPVSTLSATVFGNGLWVASGSQGSGGLIFNSRDAIEWEPIEYNAFPNSPNDVAFNGGSMWAVVSSTGVASSTDGRTWIKRPGVGVTLNGIAHNQVDRWVAVGNFDTDGNTIISTSTDGIIWSSEGISASLATLSKVTYNSVAGLWIATANNGHVFTSTTGVPGTWTNVDTVVTTQPLQDVAHDSIGTWVAVGNAGTVITSPDGSTWTSRTSNTANQLFSVVYSSTLGLWIAVGGAGTVITSPDGVTAWTVRTSGTTVGLNHVAENAGMLTAVSSISDVILTSTDAINWSTWRAPVAVLSSLRSIIYAHNEWMAVGDSNPGKVFTTQNPASIAPISDIYINNNEIRAFRLLTSADGYDTNLSITNNTIYGMELNSNKIMNSKFVGNTINNLSIGNPRLPPMDNCLFANNIVIGGTISTASGSQTNSTEFVGNTFNAGVTLSSAFNDSKFLDGYVNGTLTIGGIVTNSDISGNNVNALSIGSSSLITSSRINNNFVNTTITTGRIVNSNMMGNIVTGDYSPSISNTNFVGNIFSGGGGIPGTKTYANGQLLVAVGQAGKIATSPDGVTWTQRANSYAAADTIFGIVYNGKDTWLSTSAGKIAYSSDGITWGQVSSINVLDIAYNGKDLWVAVGNSGVIYTSSDGINWFQQVNGFGSNGIFGVAHNGKDLWVAVGVSGKLATSPDGINWTLRESSFSVNISDVAHNGKDLWVAVGDTGFSVATSPDGLTWTQRTSPISGTTYSVAYNGKDLWLIGGDTGQIASSPDGITWTLQTTGLANAIGAIVHTGSLWVVSSNNVIATSPDGVTWTAQTSSFGASNVLDLAVQYGSNAGVVGIGSTANGSGIQGFGHGNKGIGVEGFGGDGYAVGVKGISGAVGGAGVQGFGTGGFAFGGEFFGAGLGSGIYAKGGFNGTSGGKLVGDGYFMVAVGQSGKINTSVDGVTWVSRTSGFGSIAANAVAHNGKDLWIVVGDTGRIATSPDGLTWTLRANDFGASSFGDIAHDGKGLWVAVGAGGIETSPDGITWTQRNVNLTTTSGIASIASVAHNGKDLWILVASLAVMATSTDGISWVRVADSSFAGTFINDIAYDGKNTWLAVGGAGKIATSSDGINWIQCTSGIGTDLRAVTYNGKDLWVAVGSSGVIITSSDGGVTWTTQVSGFGADDIHDIAHNGQDLWVAVGGTGKLATSNNGVDWYQQVNSFGADAIVGVAMVHNSNAGLVAHGSPYNGTGIQGFGHGNKGIGIEGFGGDGYAVGVRGVSGLVGGAGVQGLGVGGFALGGEFFGAGFAPGAYAKAGSIGAAGIEGMGSDGYLLVAVAQPSQVATSSDGANWTLRTSNLGAQSAFDIEYDGKGLWVAVGSNGNIITSPDAINWTVRNAGFGADSVETVAYNGRDLWVACAGATSKFATSADGITWIQRTHPFFISVGGMATIAHNGKDLWVVAGSTRLATSTDGINWTERTSSFSAGINDIVYNGNDMWVAVGNPSGTAQLATSHDGINWTQQTNPFGGTQLLTVAYNGKDFWVAAGTAGTLGTSPDGINWTLRTSSFGATSISDVIYNGKDAWIAVGDSGKIATSIDGTLWDQQTNSFSIGTIFSIASAYGSNAGVVGHGSSYNGAGVQGFGHGNTGSGVEGFGGDGYAVGVKGVSGLAGGVGVEGFGLGSFATGGSFYSMNGPAAGLSSTSGGTFYVATGGLNFTDVIVTSTDGVAWGRATSSFAGLADAPIRAVAHNGKDLWVAASGNTSKLATSPDGINWTQRTIPAAGSISDVAHNGNDLWVAVGGAIYTSYDGITWTNRPAPLTASLFAVAYNKGLWVAVGVTALSGVIITSPDGLNWTITAVTTGAPAPDLVGVEYGDGIWVAVGGLVASSTIMISLDSMNWTTVTSGFATELFDVAYNGKDLWVAVGAAGLLVTSPNGVNWTQQVSGFSADSIRTVAYDGGLWFIAGDNGKISASPDGVTWTARTNTSTNDAIYKMAILSKSNSGTVSYGSKNNGTGVQGFGRGNKGIGVEGFGGDGYAVGVKGISGATGGAGVQGYGAGGYAFGGEFYGAGVAPGIVSYGSGTMYIAGGQSGTLATSPEGFNWTQQLAATSIFGSDSVEAIEYNGRDLWVAVGSNGKLAVSFDGIKWLSKTSNFGASTIQGIDYNSKGLWVIVGDSGKLCTSTDGVTWTTQTSSFAATDTIHSVAYDNQGVWIAGGGQAATVGKVATSSDGKNWTQQTVGFGTDPVFAVAASKNLLIAVGGSAGTSSKLATSVDKGVNWTIQSTGFGTTFISAIAYNNKDLWVAAGQSGKIATSTDGITWTQQSATTFGADTILDVIYDGNNQWIAVGTSAKIATSPDGVHWTLQTNSFGANFISTLASVYGSNAGVVGYGAEFDGTGIRGFGGGSFGIGVEGIAGDGYGDGVRGIGGLRGGTGVYGQGGGIDGYGILGVGGSGGSGGPGIVGIGGGGSGTVNNEGIGVIGIGSGLGAGLKGIGGTAGGAGIVGVGGTGATGAQFSSSTTNGAILITPTTTTPSTPDAGELFVYADGANRLQMYDGTEWGQIPTHTYRKATIDTAIGISSTSEVFADAVWPLPVGALPAGAVLEMIYTIEHQSAAAPNLTYRWYWGASNLNGVVLTAIPSQDFIEIRCRIVVNTTSGGGVNTSGISSMHASHVTGTKGSLFTGLSLQMTSIQNMRLSIQFNASNASNFVRVSGVQARIW